MVKRDYLALTAMQARQLADALQASHQSGCGVMTGRQMAEQVDIPPALAHVRIYVRKHQDKPGYYSSLGHLAGGSWAGDVAETLGGVSGTLGTAGLVAGLAGPPGWAGTAALETGAAVTGAAAGVLAAGDQVYEALTG